MPELVIAQSEAGRHRSRTASTRRRRARAATAVVVGALLAADPAAGTKGAAAKLAPPRAGAWKLLLAINTAHGPTFTNTIIGGFRVTRRHSVTGLHLTFTEEGETSGCAGGSMEAPKSGTVSVTGSVPILHARGAWRVAASSGSIGGGTLQPEEVSVLRPNGIRGPGMLSMVLSASKGRRMGALSWGADTCSVSFVAKPPA